MGYAREECESGHVELEGLEEDKFDRMILPPKAYIELKAFEKKSAEQVRGQISKAFTVENLQTASIEAGKILAGFTAAGLALDANDVYMAYKEGDGWGMLVSGIGFIPVGGGLWLIDNLHQHANNDVRNAMSDIRKRTTGEIKE